MSAVVRHEPQGQSENIPAVSESAAVISMIERAARDVSLPLDRLEKLMELRERMEVRAAERAFDDSMNAAQLEMRPVATDSANSSTKSRYASYQALDKALRPIYTRHGFSLSFNTIPGAAPAGEIRLICDVAKAGARRRYEIDMPADGKGAKGGDVMTRTHATGAGVTYGMRYLLKMIFNIIVGEDDDDGNAADGGDKITEAQVIGLREELEALGADQKRFLDHMRAASLADIPLARMPAAREALDHFRNRKAQQK